MFSEGPGQAFAKAIPMALQGLNTFRLPGYSPSQFTSLPGAAQPQPLSQAPTHTLVAEPVGESLVLTNPQVLSPRIEPPSWLETAPVSVPAAPAQQVSLPLLAQDGLLFAVGTTAGNNPTSLLMDAGAGPASAGDGLSPQLVTAIYGVQPGAGAVTTDVAVREMLGLPASASTDEVKARASELAHLPEVKMGAGAFANYPEQVQSEMDAHRAAQGRGFDAQSFAEERRAELLGLAPHATDEQVMDRLEHLDRISAALGRNTLFGSGAQCRQADQGFPHASSGWAVLQFWRRF